MQKKLIYILLLISLFSLTFGCQTESYDFGREDGSIEVLEDGRLRVPILLHIPEREVVETKTTPNETETTINNAYVLVFEVDDLDSNNQKVYSLLQCVEATQNPSDKTKIYADLKTYPKSCLIHILANLSPDNEAEVKAATKLDNIRHLVENKDNSLDLNPALLPLSSAGVQLSAISTTTVTNLTILLNFAYARIDVNAEDIKGQFTLHEAYVFKAARIGYVIEHAGINIDPDGTPSKTCSANENNINGIYVFENNGAKPENTQGSNPTDLIIKGTKTGFGEGYYKIRIAYLKENIKTYDIRRGVRYAVKITSVKGPGYTSAEEAELHEPSNVEYDITVNDGSSKDVIVSNGKYYLGVSNSEYIIYADDARGVIPVTIMHNAPKQETTAKITLSGAGMSFSSPLQSESELVISGNEATIKQRDGFVHTIPLRIDFAANNLTAGSITIRIGDLVKTIRVVRKAYLSETSPQTIQLAELGLTNCSVVESQSPRIVVNSNELLTVNSESGPSTRVFSTVKAFSASSGNVVIAVKRKVVNVVYYEKYADGKYGLFLTKNIPSTLDNADRVIVEAGYGVVDTEAPVTKSIQIGGDNQNDRKLYSDISGVSSRDLFEDYEGVIYRVNQNELRVSDSNYITYQVKFGGKFTNFCIYRNFAKGVYSHSSSNSSITDGGASASPFVIRTPKQFQNINTMAVNSTSRFFKQERDLDFSDENIGGQDVFTSAIITNDFKGNYDGAGKRISNLKLNNTKQSMALFRTNSGTLRDIRLYNINVTGKNYTSCLAGTNNSTIQTILIEESKVISYGQFSGGISGHNKGYINNCMITCNTTNKGSFIYSYWKEDNNILIGTISGCNHSSSRGIENVYTIDLSRYMTNRIVDAYYITNPKQNHRMNYTGGLVGKNASMLKNAVFIAQLTYDPFLYNNSRLYYPVTGVGNEGDSSYPEESYFLSSSININYLGGGIKQTTNRFNSYPNVINTSWSNFWERVEDYPYPKLKSFPVPPKGNYPEAN